jgi:hypothetical protein
LKLYALIGAPRNLPALLFAAADTRRAHFCDLHEGRRGNVFS